MSEVLHDLKDELRILNIKRLDVANYCNVSYSQLNNYINGYTPIPYSIDRKIKEYIIKRKLQASRQQGV